MKTILKLRDICKKYHSCYDDCPFHVDHECVLTIPPANWSDENLYLISKALEQESRWIPVSERLPKAGEYIGNVERYYLVQNEYGDMLVARYTHSRYWEQIYQLKPICDEIVAWMPLPKPYVSQESKDKEFHCGVEESGFHAYNCNDCPNKCEEWHQWDKETKNDRLY